MILPWPPRGRALAERQRRARRPGEASVVSPKVRGATARGRSGKSARGQAAEVDNDMTLAVLARAGDDRAFAQLVARHEPGLQAFLRRYVDADAALDVAQEALVAAWRALARFDEARDFGTWLRVVALNKCRDRARRMAVRRTVLGEGDDRSREAEIQPDPAPSGEDQVLRAEVCQTVRSAVARLPSSLREPLLLTYFAELTQQDAAAFLGVTPKAVETRLRRARLRLAQLLKGHPNDRVDEGSTPSPA